MYMYTHSKTKGIGKCGDSERLTVGCCDQRQVELEVSLETARTELSVCV